MNLEIITDTTITSSAIYKDGTLFLANEEHLPFAQYCRKAYQLMEASYPKFFKMDNLCKLSFLTAELLLTENIGGALNGEKTAIILGNRSSSIISDQKHYESYVERENSFPSPAVFVYTLPNIMLGELCIRHQITGESSCFMMEDMDAAFLFHYVQDLLLNEGYEHCITGWVDFSPTEYGAELYLIGKRDKGEVKRPFGINFNQKV
ncbi:3-oxoacyl-[acyl-carrier protein] reductase [Fulvivirga imtechensis AK7]|uniref:3-oxoacyl-[acyl-carrier protein] reductase n=1 Tax=Fulvivirga imtechensis AK7 TaxID=1237149 RepID=L8JQS6_9BACT|nr:3-oxoacyl-[acyl-carrier-protein] reductase [Fulvivirga imtechensis]ELR71306.1 3-oxoacyl-[acyl-carrier protein] reductase [Fulvivirga imtechensis AK7]